MLKMEKYNQSVFNSTCKECGVKITILNKFNSLPCNSYCCKCCPESDKFPCPREIEYGTMLEQVENDTSTLILKALQKKKIFIGYMMLCRYINNRGYIRFGCNAGYPNDDKSGNAKINPCPILCPETNHSLSKIKYHVKQLAKSNELYLKKSEFYDSKNPYSNTSPKKTDLFMLISISRECLENYLKLNTLEAYL